MKYTPMLPRVDFSSLYKFVVSIGLAAAITAVLLPAILVRIGGASLVTTEELKELTPLGIEIVTRQQEHQRWFLFNYLYLSVPLALIGIAVSSYGLTHWSRRQRVQDEIEDAQKARAVATLEVLDEREVSLKQTEEAKQAVVDSMGIPGPPVGGGTQKEPKIHDRVEALRAEVRAAEAAVQELLESAAEDTHDVIPHVRLSSVAGVATIVDFFVRPRVPHSGSYYVIDVKYVSLSTSRGVARRLRDTGVRLAEAASAIGEMCKGVGILVVGHEGGLDLLNETRDLVSREARAIKPALSADISFTVLPLAELSSEGMAFFTSLFGHRS
jgi:hypothetical protein